jgi:hypothetical protein
MAATIKAAQVAQDTTFQQRVRVILVECATICISEDNQARHKYSQLVVTGKANMLSAAYAVVADPTIRDAIEADDPPTEEHGVTDEMISEAIMPEGLGANGLFNTLSLANAS